MKRLVILFFLGMVSCSIIELPDIPECKSENNPFSVSMTEALSIASSLMTDKGLTPTTRSEDLFVRKAFSIYDKSNEPMFHVINYEGGGFVIVAGDMRFRPIQAYSSTGFFNDKKGSYPLGLKIWLTCAEAYRNSVIENGEDLDDETQLAWYYYLSKNNDVGNIKTRSLDPFIDPPLEEVDTLVGPLIHDSWHQESPYNDSLQICDHYSYHYFDYPYPLIILENEGQFKPVVGCVPLAIARVLRYNEKPYNYSWSSMPDIVPQTVETVSFVRDVHYALKTYADNHNCGFLYLINGDSGNPETAVSDSFPIGAFLCDQYNYPAAITETYTSGASGKIRREIFDHHLPCILSGHSSSSSTSDGHTWVCDGYHYHFLPMFGPGGEYMGGFESKYLYHHWGWENCENDGWFQYYDYTPGDYDFHFDMKITHQISELNYWSMGL